MNLTNTPQKVASLLQAAIISTNTRDKKYENYEF